MRKVITTVGTSIFSNNPLEGQSALYEKKLKNRKATDEWENQSTRIENIRKETWKKIKNTSSADISAETQSLVKIQEKLKEDIEVYLLATDTILCQLSAEIIKIWMEEHYPTWEIKFSSQPGFDVIKGLQVQSLSLYRREGFSNLIKRIRKIANDGNYWEDIVFNITGGYKGIIPILTTIAQVEGIPCYYIFQDENENNPDLIEIPPIPLEIRSDLFKKHYLPFQKITGNVCSREDFSSYFLQDVEHLLYEEEGFILLNEFYSILWEKFSATHFAFYASDKVYQKILTQPNVQHILSKKLWNSDVRHGANVEKKGEHRHVFDDGKNGNRVYFFKENEAVFIYQTFDNDHDGHEKYLKTPFNDNLRTNIIEDGTLRLIEIKK
jgi:putative CRISPR-associated protein (TIGR02619 family)